MLKEGGEPEGSHEKENHSRSFEWPTFKMKQKADFESQREIPLKEAVASQVRKGRRDQLARRPGCRTRPGRFHQQSSELGSFPTEAVFRVHELRPAEERMRSPRRSISPLWRGFIF